LLLSDNLFGQKLGTPLEPQAPPQQMELGIIFGLGNNIQSGIYQPKCPECQFEDAQGFGIIVGAIFIRDFNSKIQWGSALFFNTLNSKTSYQRMELNKLWIKKPTDFVERTYPYRNVGEFQVGEITLIPFLQYSPVEFLFLRMGIGASILTDYKFKHTKELLKLLDTLNGQIVDIVLNNENPIIETVEDDEIAGTNVLRFTLEPTIGFNFEISNQIYFLPSFTYSIPITKFSSMQNDFNLNRWRIMLELRLALKLRNIKIN